MPRIEMSSGCGNPGMHASQDDAKHGPANLTNVMVKMCDQNALSFFF